MEERIFDNINIKPYDVMRNMLEKGSITLDRYMQWLITDQSWKSVEAVVTENIINIILTENKN